MSSLPGYTLEAFLSWNYDLIVGGDGSANPSLQIAELLGTATRRRREITDAQMKELAKLFEHHRERVEYLLEDCGEDYSWRQYAEHAFDFITDAEYEAGFKQIEDWLSKGSTT